MGLERGALTALCCAALACALAWPAHAQNAGRDVAGAEALFETGKQLMAEGKHVEACSAFEESLKLDDGIGTRFQLARCWELTGRTASAWALYLEVAAASRALGQSEREELARGEAARLKPKLNTLVILVPEAHRVAGLEVLRNQAPVGQSQWGLQLPVDPGKYEITARASGKQPWTSSVDIAGEGATQSVTVPKLVDAQIAAAPLKTDLAPGPQLDTGSSAAPGKWTALHYTGLGVAAAGVIGLGIGGLFALDATSKDSDSGCDDAACPDRDALDAKEEARSSGNIATVAVITGAVLAAGGVTLFLLAPKAAEGSATVQVSPGVSRSFAGAVLGGRF